MFKVVVTLDYWPITQEDPTILATLAEVVCSNVEQAHDIGHCLADKLAINLPPKNISVHYNIY